MKSSSERMIYVPIPERLLRAWLGEQHRCDAAHDPSAERLPGRGGSALPVADAPPASRAASGTARHAAEFLGETITARTLPEIFARAVDLAADLAPESLETLAAMRARRRRFVARERLAIHPGRPDLGVMRTASGWWISTNIGKEDLKRALAALALAAGLAFGTDVKYPIR